MQGKNEDVKISEAEAELYDRQIRLWGLDAQKRLRSSRVLLYGLGGLGCEVAKNLVLSGVKSIKIMDHRNLKEADNGANFLAPDDATGNRALACRERLQQLNPMVVVSADDGDLAEKSDDFYTDFDIAVLTLCSKEVKIRANNACRERGVKFFCGELVGFFGYSFADLLEHDYVEEVAKIETDDSIDKDGGEPQAKKAKTDGSSGTENVVVVKKSMKFVSLQNALAVDWTTPEKARRIKRMNPAFFLLHILLEFESREGRPPSSSPHDSALLDSLHDSISKKFSLPSDKISSSLLSLVQSSELSPVAAIVGGVLAQEIIKVISNKDAPHNNFFLFNPLDSAGVVEAVGY